MVDPLVEPPQCSTVLMHDLGWRHTNSFVLSGEDKRLFDDDVRIRAEDDGEPIVQTQLSNYSIVELK